MGASRSLSGGARDRFGRRRLVRELLRQGAWYVGAGAAATLAHALLFVVLREPLGVFPANLLAIIVTTVTNTEFHHRVTFDARGSSRLRRLLAVVVTIAFYTGYTSAALHALQLAVPNPSADQQTATIVAAAMLFGVARFTLLRVWVFAKGRAERYAHGDPVPAVDGRVS